VRKLNFFECSAFEPGFCLARECVDPLSTRKENPSMVMALVKGSGMCGRCSDLQVRVGREV
jgi:hypothetical protein